MKRLQAAGRNAHCLRRKFDLRYANPHLAKAQTRMKSAFVFLLLLATCVCAPAQSADCEALTRQALELSGFDQYVDRLSGTFVSNEFMQQFRGSRPVEEFIPIFKPILLKEFNPAALRREMHDRVSAHCDAQQMALTVEQLQTPLQAKMLALEAAANTPEGQEQLKKYIEIAKTAPPTEERIEALDAIDSSTGASDFVTDTVMAVMRGMMTGQGAPQDVIAQFESHRREIKLQMQNNVELTMSVTYHGVTRPELLQYARELSAPPLKAFYALVNRTFTQLLEERARAVGQELKNTASPGKS